METGITVQLLLPLSAEEMMASGTTTLEPHHMLSGGLKFVELEEKEFASIIRPREAVGLFVALRDDARKVLVSTGCTIPEGSTRLRRALRAVRSPGRQGAPGSGMHRSESLRKLWGAAENIAESAGKRHWEVADFFQALIENIHEYPEIVAIFRQEGLAASREATPWDALGGSQSIINLSAMVSRERTPTSSAQEETICKSVLRVLSGAGDGKHILLIKTQNSPLRSLFERIAHEALQEHAPEKVKHKSFFLAIPSKEKGPVPLLKEIVKTVKSPEDIVVCCELEEADTADLNELQHIATRTAGDSGAVLIVAITDTDYADLRQKHGKLKRDFFAVWVHGNLKQINL